MENIATYHIQNKYEHALGAQMLMKENVAFVAFQEIHASHHNKNKKRHDFLKKELESARISVFET